MRSCSLKFILFTLSLVAQTQAYASTASTLHSATTCENELTSNESMYVRILRVFIERTRSNPQRVAQILARIKKSPIPLNPFLGATSVFERQIFESLQIELSRDISAQWTEIKKRLSQNQKEEKVQDEDRDSRAEEMSRILSFELAAKSPASDEIWGLSSFTNNGRSFISYGSMRKWGSPDNQSLLLEMNRETGELTPIQPQKFVGGLSAQFANGPDNDFVLLANDSSRRRIYQFDQNLNLKGECVFPETDGMTLIRLRTGEAIAIDYYNSPFTIWKCENGKAVEGARSPAAGSISDTSIFQLFGRTFAWGLVPKPDGYPRPILFEITDDLKFVLVDLDRFPLPVMSIESGRYTPFRVSVEPMTEILRTTENNFFFQESEGRLKFVKSAPSKVSSSRMGGNSPELLNGVKDDYLIATTQQGLYAYRYLNGGSLEISDHFQLNGEAQTLSSWKNPDGRNFVLYMIEDDLLIFSFDTDTGKFNLELRIKELGKTKSKPILIPGRKGQVFVALAQHGQVEIYRLYKKLDRAAQ